MLIRFRKRVNIRLSRVWMLIFKLSSLLLLLSSAWWKDILYSFALSFFRYKWEPKVDSKVELFWNMRVIFYIEDWRQAVSPGYTFHNYLQSITFMFAKWRVLHKRTQMYQQKPITNIKIYVLKFLLWWESVAP